ncbi:TPA: DUF1002 domain-containing protein, partial [Streptococcus equi subsp. equi]|nr:DUF1002 domain-containing protein [Streptococcus equi subsp. equi]
MTYQKKLIAASMALASVFMLQTVHAAANNVQQVIDETYVQPDYVLGYSLSAEQREQTLALLHYNSASDNKLSTLNTTAYASIMNVADDPSLQLYSSVRIQKLGAKETLKVT